MAYPVAPPEDRVHRFPIRDMTRLVTGARLERLRRSVTLVEIVVLGKGAQPGERVPPNALWCQLVVVTYAH